MRCQALYFGNVCIRLHGSAYAGPVLSKRRSTLPPLTAFGSVLRQLREARRLSTGQVETKLQAAAAKLGRSTVAQYEKGAVWSPDPVVLSELARLYRSDLAGVIAVLKANRQDPSLSRAGADAILKGASDGGAVAAGVLEAERDAAWTAIREVRNLAARIVAITAGDVATEKGGAAGKSEPVGGTGDRAAR